MLATGPQLASRTTAGPMPDQSGFRKSRSSATMAAENGAEDADQERRRR